MAQLKSFPCLPVLFDSMYWVRRRSEGSWGLTTVYMFYLNWQTFIQTSIMCNVNILSINYIATSLFHSSLPNFTYYIRHHIIQLIKQKVVPFVHIYKVRQSCQFFLFVFLYSTKLVLTLPLLFFSIIHLVCPRNYVFPSCNLSKVYKGLFLLLN